MKSLLLTENGYQTDWDDNCDSEVYLGPCQASMMELFNNGWQTPKNVLLSFQIFW